MSRSHWLCRVFALSAVLWIAPACGGDDDGGVTVADGGGGGAEADAGAGGAVSAQNLGVPCDDANPCPNEGEGCLTTSVDGPGFCSILCEEPGDPACASGYTGPGAPGCFLELTGEDGSPSGMFACGVICDAPDEQCPADVCDGTSCPGDLVCVPATGEGAEGFAVCDYEVGGPGPGGPDAGVAPRRAKARPAMIRAHRVGKK
jgi:hypothetical protein